MIQTSAKFETTLFGQHDAANGQAEEIPVVVEVDATVEADPANVSWEWDATLAEDTPGVGNAGDPLPERLWDAYDSFVQPEIAAEI